MLSISIITATFNAEKYVLQCIESVNRQDIEGIDLEHIFVDGLSEDNTLEIIKQSCIENAVIISELDNGIYDAMNKGIEASSGDIIGILNADDFYSTDNVLSLVCKAFEKEKVMACYGDLQYINKKNQIVRDWLAGKYDSKSFSWGWMPPHPTFFVRKSVYDQFGFFNTDLGTAADYELMLRLMQRHKLNTKYIPETLVHMRTGGVSNVSLINRIKANRMDYMAWKINELSPLPWTVVAKPIRKIFQWRWVSADFNPSLTNKKRKKY